MSVEYYSCESRLLREIANYHFKRRHIAETYRDALYSGEEVDWEKVHQAIIERWSYFALEWIRREANRRAMRR